MGEETTLRQENHKRYTANNAEKSASSAAEGASNVYGGNDHAAATCSQAGYHGYGCREDLRGSSEEQNKAAMKIQSSYRGYVTRKKQAAPAVRSETMEKGSKDQEKAEREAAAINIQAAYRGHGVRETTRPNGTRNHEGERTCANERTGAVKNQRSNAEHEKAAAQTSAGYVGYRTRKHLTSRQEAATTIQAYYRGCRERKQRRAKSQAAVVIQRSYRGYRSRKSVRKQPFAASFLDISSDHGGFDIHRDSRTSFSLPAGVQFEGSLDDDSDTEIDKIVDRMETSKRLKAIQEASSPEITEEQEGHKIII